MPFDLILGGVRSGKSRLAVEAGRRADGPVRFIATAAEVDADMADRISRHRNERPSTWATIEEPCDLLGALDRCDDAEFIVLDCLTVWTSNVMFAEVDPVDIVEQARVVAERLASREGQAVVVSNEVGMGVHPFSELGRQYRDLLGAVNVVVGARAQRAALVMAGHFLPLQTVDAWLR
mgnify:CR=1 FL=1